MSHSESGVVGCCVVGHCDRMAGQIEVSLGTEVGLVVSLNGTWIPSKLGFCSPFDFVLVARHKTIKGSIWYLICFWSSANDIKLALHESYVVLLHRGGPDDHIELLQKLQNSFRTTQKVNSRFVIAAFVNLTKFSWSSHVRTCPAVVCLRKPWWMLHETFYKSNVLPHMQATESRNEWVV